jgi:fluoride exporter
MMPAWMLVALGGALGSVARYKMMGWVTQRTNLLFPYGTFAVNIAGSFAVGLLAGWLAHNTLQNGQAVRTFLVVGFLGGFTTFSAFSLDTVTLIERGQWGITGLYIALSVILCIAGTFAGFAVMRG